MGVANRYPELERWSMSVFDRWIRVSGFGWVGLLVTSKYRYYSTLSGKCPGGQHGHIAKRNPRPSGEPSTSPRDATSPPSTVHYSALPHYSPRDQLLSAASGVTPRS